MTRSMQDSVNAHALTAANLYAGYVDGRYANVPAIQARFPKCKVVRITVLGTTLNADVCDIETGDCTPKSGAAWAKRKLAAKQHPTLYCNASTWPAVKAAVHAAGIDGHVSYWIAQYDGKPVIPAGAVAKQYQDHGPHGENVDLSVVADFWPGVDAGPPPPPVFSYRRVLRQGMVGSDVTALKRRLKWLGYGGTVPGPIFGRGLTAAVRTFQTHHKLTADGIVGPVTAKAINSTGGK